MSVADPELSSVLALIRDSFRVHENDDPIYIDLEERFDRVASRQHQIVFGRRGSGKSCLLVHFHQNPALHSLQTVYVNADEVKTLAYPDLLIRLLLSVFEGLPRPKIGPLRRLFRNRASELDDRIGQLRALLDEAELMAVKNSDASGAEATVGGGSKVQMSSGPSIDLSASIAQRRSFERITEFQAKKLDSLERHLQDHKSALIHALESSGTEAAAIIVDDFYLIPRQRQPDVVDYLHRLCRGTRAYLKIGTVRHRTSLLRQGGGETIGVLPKEDVESMDLDQTFEDLASTQSHLADMLDLMGEMVGVENVSGSYLSPDGLQALTLASGGVPRDYLNTFVEAVDFARQSGSDLRWVTPTHVYKGAARVYYETKLANLRTDTRFDAAEIEVVLQDLLVFCLTDKRKTAFLVGQEDRQAFPAEHELLMQLMDFKLIHIIEPNTSAASGRAGRFEAYTLDFAFFMEPRRRNIEVVEFWKVDSQRRRVGVREAPVYPLSRAREALATAGAGSTPSTESVLASMSATPDSAPADPPPPDDDGWEQGTLGV